MGQFLFNLANLNDFTQRKLKRPPEIKRISFELPAYGLANGPTSDPIPLMKSNPPMKARKPNDTEKCMKSFFFAGFIRLSHPKKKIGKPIIAGIHEVIDSLWVIVLAIAAHTTRKIPYLMLIFSIVLPRNLYSLPLIFSSQLQNKLTCLRLKVTTLNSVIFLSLNVTNQCYRNVNDSNRN